MFQYWYYTIQYLSNILREFMQLHNNIIKYVLLHTRVCDEGELVSCTYIHVCGTGVLHTLKHHYFHWRAAKLWTLLGACDLRSERDSTIATSRAFLRNLRKYLENIRGGYHGYKWRCTSWVRHLIYFYSKTYLQNLCSQTVFQNLTLFFLHIVCKLKRACSTCTPGHMILT
jgi:hypothetical protein